MSYISYNQNQPGLLSQKKGNKVMKLLHRVGELTSCQFSTISYDTIQEFNLDWKGKSGQRNVTKDKKCKKKKQMPAMGWSKFKICEGSPVIFGVHMSIYTDSCFLDQNHCEVI